jgi:hypothetical protein
LIEYDAFVETPADDPRARKHSFIHLEPSDSIDAALEGVSVQNFFTLLSLCLLVLAILLVYMSK